MASVWKAQRPQIDRQCSSSALAGILFENFPLLRTTSLEPSLANKTHFSVLLVQCSDLETSPRQCERDAFLQVAHIDPLAGKTQPTTRTPARE